MEILPWWYGCNHTYVGIYVGQVSLKHQKDNLVFIDLQQKSYLPIEPINIFGVASGISGTQRNNWFNIITNDECGFEYISQITKAMNSLFYAKSTTHHDN